MEMAQLFIPYVAAAMLALVVGAKVSTVMSIFHHAGED